MTNGGAHARVQLTDIVRVPGLDSDTAALQIRLASMTIHTLKAQVGAIRHG